MLKNKIINKIAQEMPLNWILTVPFLLQIFVAVGLVGYLSYKNFQESTNLLVEKLSDEVGIRTKQHLDNYLVIPHQLAQVAVDSLNTGLLKIRDFHDSGRYFWKQIQTHETISFLGYYLNNGEGVGAQRWPPRTGVNIVQHSLVDGKDYNFSTDAKGNRGALLDATEYYAPTDDWYIQVVKANKPIWTRIYTADGFPGYVAASAAYPLHDRSNKIIGALSVDLLLSEINKFLEDTKISNNGKIFIIERDGMLIGDSSSALTYEVNNNKTQRINSLESSDAFISSTALYLKNKFVSFKNIRFQQNLKFIHNGTNQFVHVIPWSDRYGLDWLVVVTIPETDFTAQIDANTRTTILLCIAALLTATLLGIMTSRWITQPILRLSQASQAIALGDLDQKVQITGIRELQGLSQAFNRMAEQLRGWVNLLEHRVAERTAQLDEAKQSAENAKEVAIAANRSKSQFLANMSHELRTPLNAILGFSQVMNRDSSLSNNQQESLHIIIRSGEHLLSLINDVLDMSKIEAGRASISKSDFSLYHLLDSVKDLLSLRAQVKELDLTFYYEDEIPEYIKADEKKIRQVLLNLLGNAVKFTESGFVSLKVNLENESEQPVDDQVSLRFVVEDSGPGIAQHELSTVFEPFVQTESGRKSEQGTGLGLSISRSFVELMGGKLQVYSTLGQGTRFEFAIPVGVIAPVAPQQHPVRRVTGLVEPHPRYRILVVDDHRENRQLLLKLLEPIGFEVREAANGQEAIAAWETWHPHLIWMDMRMPILDGFDATRHIKSHLQGQSTVIIALTASVLHEEIPIIKSVGCNDYVYKPFAECEIFDKIGQYLNVEYVYETLAPNVPAPLEILTPAAFAVMPSRWLADLAQASAQLDKEAILSLIDQIPEEHTSLRKSIQAKVDNFDFDHILAIVQQVQTKE